MDVGTKNHTNGMTNGNSFDSNRNDDIKKEPSEEYVSDDDVPWGKLIEREKKNSSGEKNKKKRRKNGSDDDDDDYKPEKKKDKKKKHHSDSEDDYKPEKPKSKKKPKKEESDSEEDFKPESASEFDGGDDTKENDADDDSDDDVPLAIKYEVKKEVVGTEEKSKKKKKKHQSDEESGDGEEDKNSKKKNEKKKGATSNGTSASKKKNEKKADDNGSPKKKKKVEDDLEDVWEWWKEPRKPDGVKWYSLEHKGPLFAPPYVPLPDNVNFKYNGKPMKLSIQTEEIATFYAAILDHDYTSKEQFNTNFFNDWRNNMTSKERETITDFKKCDFRNMAAYLKELREARKAMTKEEKQKIKEEREAEMKVYGVAVIDGHRQKVANFRIEPPGLFRGRGGHPKMGMLKKRVNPEDIIINCSKDSVIPKPPPGHKWKEVRHDNSVSWLCSWTENVLGQNKYIMFNPSSKIKGEKDYEKYETARRLKSHINNIRAVYTEDFKSKEMRVRQRAVALYFIDKLALRAGNEKDVDEVADTVGCCSLRVEHIKLFEKTKLNESDKHEKDYVVEFDFPGKDSIRYFNRVPVEKRVFKNLKLFMENKSPGDDLFDRLDTATLNEHLRSLMPGLTVKVFRTYNASITLQEQLQKLTDPNDNLPSKLLSYNRANRQVAILCNHQRAISKNFEKSMENLEAKIKDKKKDLDAAKKELEQARGAAKDKAQKKVDRIKEQLKKLKIARTDKDENKQIALSTSKLNYLDPRITVAWCKKYDVPLEKVFTKTHREKFRWAIDMTMSTDEEYIF
ncbi:unnamed protein product [Caenorhabditis bovis]|uniref:DNA topoisomerase I n=1 Tax=Caenorhabditis bovis TaxID=2654633 RepID=A0A8S1F6N8_9PELO|nr:unnamed protein product [Caenorhabditis bovis]